MTKLIDEFIRDVTKATPMAKSEVKRRLNEILKDYEYSKSYNKAFNDFNKLTN